MAWQPMLPGNIRDALGAFVKPDWTGPDNVQGFEETNGDIRKVRSDWTKPDGSRRRIEVRYLRSSTKIISSPLARTDQQ